MGDNQNPERTVPGKQNEAAGPDGDLRPVRVLMVFGKLGLGGGESRTMDLYRRVDRSKVQFDFLVHCDRIPEGKKIPTSEELMALRAPEHFDEEILSLGGHIYGLPRFTGKNLFSYRKAAEQFFRQHAGEWTAVHGHMTSTASLYMPYAAKYGARTITHLRSGGTDPGLKGLITKVLRLPLRNEGTVDYRFSCSEEAAEAVYGRKALERGQVRVIPNAIDVERFAYDEAEGMKVRRELGIPEDALVIGHVGRFHYAKNHEFLLKIFAEICGRMRQAGTSGTAAEPADRENGTIPAQGPQEAFLVMCGEGELLEAVKAQAAELGIEKNCVFAGNHRDVERFYSAFDLFVFPSRYEGLPGTVVEAQASGLPVLMSDGLTKAVDITPLVNRCSLGSTPEQWADRALSFPVKRGEERAKLSSAMRIKAAEAGFDAAVQAGRLQKFYLGGSI